jgi:hypothetical protein
VQGEQQRGGQQVVLTAAPAGWTAAAAPQPGWSVAGWPLPPPPPPARRRGGRRPAAGGRRAPDSRQAGPGRQAGDEGRRGAARTLYWRFFSFSMMSNSSGSTSARDELSTLGHCGAAGGRVRRRPESASALLPAAGDSR